MTLTIVNLVLTTVILILGVWAYFKRRSDIAQGTSRAIAIPEVSLFLGIAFGLFAVSHALTLAGFGTSLEAFIIVIRVIGYLLVMVAPVRVLLKK